jgi:hypothetical protein
MSLEVSDITIRDICEPFEVSNPEVSRWCEWMRNFHTDPEAGSDVIDDNITLNTAQKVAILGARRVFIAKGTELVSSLSSHPNYQQVLKAVRLHVLRIEGSMIPLHVIFDRLLKGAKNSKLSKTLTDEPGTNIVSNPKFAYGNLETFIVSTFTFTQCLYNNTTDEGLSDDRYELLKALDVDVQATTVNFNNWNPTIVTGLMKQLNNSIHPKVDSSKRQQVLERVEALLNAQDFTSITLEEIKMTLEVFHALVPGYILAAMKVKLRPVEAKGRTNLEPKHIEQVLKSVEYAGLHPRIKGPIETHMRRNLTEQLKSIQLESKFVPELAYTVQNTFQSARVTQGHRVGAIAAMAVGEDASQAGLRSFHHAGVSGATGFDRVKEVTDNPDLDNVTNGFTIIAIKGNPDESQAQLYVHLIEETRISDICEIVVGRRDVKVPEISKTFGETPIFEAEKGGWQDRYVNLVRLLDMKKTKDQKSQDSSRPSFNRPEWLLRLRCNKSKMYQKRITPANIAEIIEGHFADMRVIPSDFETGLIDVYVDTRGSSQNFGIADAYAKLTMQSIPVLSGKIVQGVYGFHSTFTEKFEITKFISSIKQSEGSHVINFNPREVKVNGISSEDITNFLRNKIGPTATLRVVTDTSVRVPKDLSYQVVGFEGNLREKILAPEVVRLVDVVTSKSDRDGSLVVQLDKRKMLAVEDVSVYEVLNFFSKQNELQTFASIDISFDRSDFTVTLSRAQDFTPQVLAEEFSRFGVSSEVSFQADSIVYNNVRSDVDYARFQIAVKGYGSNLSAKVNRKERQITLTLHPMSVSGAWGLLEAIQDCNSKIYTTFAARKRQRLGERYRILTKGIGLSKLVQLEFVNIYATHSSVPREYYKYFDIEAARDYINSELVLNVGGDIGDRHLGLISDVMCYMGNTIKMKLSGKRATNAGPLATAYVEQSFKLLMDSAAGYQFDNLNSAVGMTLIADFNRGQYGSHGDEKASDETKSAIDLLMSSTVTTRKVVKPKPQEPEHKVKIVTDVKPDLFEDY